MPLTNLRLLATFVAALHACYALSMLGGCAVGPNEQVAAETSATVQKNIVIGRTTKADVVRMYGQPNSTHAKGGYEAWEYIGYSAKAFVPIVGTSQRATYIAVVFDKGGVVRDMKYSQP